MLIDSHCHIPLIKDEEAGATGVVERAVAAGVSHMLCVGVDLESFEGVRNVAEQFENVYASVGVHPNTELSAQEPSINDLLTRADDPDVVAIGETGLDYFRSDGNLDWQRARFRTHIRAAHAAQKTTDHSLSRSGRRPVVDHAGRKRRYGRWRHALFR